MEPSSKKYKALIIGATGACGRELVSELLRSQNWEKVSVVVRRSLEEWDELEGKEKLEAVNVESLDELQNFETERFTGYDACFCGLGGRTKWGKEKFVQVDYTYAVDSAKLAEKSKIPYFGVVSSSGAKANSWFLYLSTKGKMEASVSELSIGNISLFRPGLITQRRNDKRMGESLAGILPISKVSAAQVGLAMRLDAENKLKNDPYGVQIFENGPIKAFKATL